jgi:hypothetical protein
MSGLRCLSCAGSGKVMGGGMIYKDCMECNASGKRTTLDVVMNKESEEYKISLEKIKSLDDKLTNDDAKKLLDDELQRIEKEEKVIPIKKRKK